VTQESTVQAFLDALNSGDVNGVESVLAPDFEFEEVAGAGQPSRAALVSELELIGAAFPDIQYRPVRQTSEGDRRYVEFKAIGSHRGPFLGVPPTGNLVIVSGVFNLETTEESVRRLRLTVDFGGLRRQLLLAARATASPGATALNE